MELAQITERLNALTSKADEAIRAAEADSSKVEEVKSLLEGTDGQPGLMAEVAELRAAREAALREEEFKSMKTKVTDLQSVIEDLRKPSGEFTLPTEDAEGKALDDEVYGSFDASLRRTGGERSVFADIRRANRGDSEARGRLTRGFTGLSPEGKALNDAMVEGTDARGGYLVRPAIERQIVLARELDNVMRSLCSSLNVTTNAIQLDQLGLSTTAGWVAELADKPEGTGMTIASVTASVFTAAGLATISNQLLADSNPAVDGLVTADLTKRLVALEETAFLAGSGTGQPLGLLNTPGLSTTTLTSTDDIDLLDSILDAIADVQTNHGQPSAILMHPRTWTRILKMRESTTLSNAFIIDPASGPQDPRTGLRGPRHMLWGVPVVTSNRVPTNLGTGTNESRVIVGDFREALILDRQGITLDESEHVYFTNNATVFRAEMRVGFTAARTPRAFNVIGGAGLARS